MPGLVFRSLCKTLRGYQTVRGVEIDEAAIEKCAERLMQLQDGSLAGKGDAVRSILSEELGIPDGISRSRNWVNEITSVLNEIQWKSTLTIRTGIGQSILLVTPIEAVRYVSAIANGGTVYNAHIVKNVVSSGGETLVSTEPSVFNKIDAPEEYWTAIRRGTAGDAFSEEFEQLGYLAKISGKTGSAQVGNVTIDIQNTSWFVSFAPNDNPDIAICVCIPNGLSGSSSAGAIEDIMTYYFSKLDARSPETLAKLENGTVCTFPLAGTRPRGKTEEEDQRLERELLADEKELAEHNMLVDLGRNDVGKISRPGSVKVDKYMEIQRFSHVMHIGSTVTGTISEEKDALDVVDAILPAGTLSGAPKIRACEIIAELEKEKRGIYGGAVGYLDFAGNVDTCISIRLAYKKNGSVRVQSGAGIVADSIPENEFQECLNKAGAVLQAIKIAEGGLG